MKSKKQLIEEFMRKQAEEKVKWVETTFQFWDGSHQPSKIRVKKGTTIAEFIKAIITQLGPLYKNLEGAPVEGFLYVKGDFIIPPVSSTHCARTK